MLDSGGSSGDGFGYSAAVSGATAIIGANTADDSGAMYIVRGFTGTDCNTNGLDDDCEIISGSAADDNGNGIPDACELPGDIDGDGLVNVTDLLILLGTWGPCADCDACPADFDGDCDVGTTDLLVLLANWTL